jgi:transposase-like protein
MKTFKSILQFAKEFDTDAKCRLYLEEQRWGGTPACHHCGSINVCRFANNSGVFKCREKQCRKKFTVTCGTVYQDRKLPLTKIFLAVYVLGTHSKGISSLQLANLLDISQKTAWLLNHKVRAMLKEGEKELLNGEIELDETFIGGKDSNKHKGKRTGKTPSKSLITTGISLYKKDTKTPVFGILQRSGIVRAFKVDNVKVKTLLPIMVDNVTKDSSIFTDEYVGYQKLNEQGFKHESVSHVKLEYVRGNAHTQGIENFWSILKRQINGIHHFVSPKHLQRYCDEAAFRYNNRAKAQDERFAIALTQVNGSLQWKELVS